MTFERDQVATALTEVFGRSQPTDREAAAAEWLWGPLLHSLAEGAPVSVADLATRTGRTAAEVTHGLSELSDTEYDDQGLIVGHGLTLRPTEHSFVVDSRQLYTWCALDTLIFPAILNAPAEVESRCHTTGVPIRLRVSPTEVVSVEPSTTVVSVVACGDLSTVRSTFCDQVHFFASPQAAESWLDGHPSGTFMPVAEVRQLVRQDTTADPCC